MDNVTKAALSRGVPELLKFNNGKPVLTEADFELRREEIKSMLEEHEYGKMPDAPEHLSIEVIEKIDRFAAGKAPLTKLSFTVTVNGEKFSFPVYSVIPKTPGKHPAFVHINFRPDVPDMYMPSEEIADAGFAVFSFCYKDVTSDDNRFRNGIARLLSPARRTMTSPGKIAMWAWAAMRVMDYIETLPEIDLERVAVVGHSRLGKTALLTGAFDKRFKFVISNDSGCSGAAISRGKGGESVARITTVFPFWFAKRYAKYASHEDALPFDQHFLLAASAPRHVLIGSAKEDLWADPASEFLSAHLASEAYEKIYGMKGLVHKGEIPEATTVLDEGNVQYHVREGVHFFSREDWKYYMNFILKNS